MAVVHSENADIVALATKCGVQSTRPLGNQDEVDTVLAPLGCYACQAIEHLTRETRLHVARSEIVSFVYDDKNRFALIVFDGSLDRCKPGRSRLSPDRVNGRACYH